MKWESQISLSDYILQQCTNEIRHFELTWDTNTASGLTKYLFGFTVTLMSDKLQLLAEKRWREEEEAEEEDEKGEQEDEKKR